MKTSEHAFFDFFDPSVAQEIAAGAELLELQDGEILFREGGLPDHLYLVLEGSVEIRKNDPAGQSQGIAHIHANDFIGELAVLDGGVRSATVAASGPVRLAGISRDVVLRHLKNANAGLDLTMKIIGRIRESNRIRVEERLREERMSLVGKMINGIIHDFRNPFAVIGLCAHIIRMDHPGAAEHCVAISEQIDRMMGMAEEVLEFSRGGTALNIRAFPLADFMARFKRLNHDYFASLKIELQVGGLEGSFRADPDKLLRVLQNLASNAAQAMEDTGGMVVVDGELDEAGGLCLRVSDNGPGIPEQVRHNLFEPFSTHGKKRGVGLGMAITHSIVTGHGGSIRFDTETGKGTVFHIHLPAVDSE